jgi:hypothetical protein
MINKMDTSDGETSCSRRSRRQQKVEIQTHPFDLDEEEEIPIITEETEEELAELETANRPRTTSGKIQVSEVTRIITTYTTKQN